ncbi:MAG: DUF2079 domain-containing protein [Nitrospira sp. CG24A]|nr:MAG: DUF2079 domain-containing protein [Nitrospira sp. CG24A]
MVDLLTYFNVSWFGVKPFHLNLFKLGIIISCVASGVWLLVSRAMTHHVMTAAARVNSMNLSQHRKFAWVLGSFFAIFLIYLRVRQYFELQTMWDMAVEANVAWHMVHGPWFFNSLDNDSFLGGHFSPVFVLIGLFYRLVEHPLTLLVIQSVALGVGAVAVYYLVLLRHVHSSLACVVVILYVSNPYVHHGNAHDFHLSPLAIPAVLWMLVFVESGKQGLAAVAAFLTFSVEESILLPLASFGLYLIAFRSGWRVFGIGLTLCATVYFILIIKVIFPMFSPSDGLFFWDRYANLGANLNDALMHLLRNPIWAGHETLIARNQYVYLIYFLIPVVFLPLLAWREACILVIPLSIMFLSQNSGMNKLGFHYTAPALPYLFFSVVHGLSNAVRLIERRWGSTQVRWNLVLAGMLFLIALNTYRSPSYDIGETNPEFAASAFEMATIVPGDAAVATDVRFAPLLINRHRICKINMIAGTLCDWTLVDGKPSSGSDAGDRRVLPQWIPDYVVIGAEPGKSSLVKLQEQREFAEWLTTVQGYEEMRNQNGIMLFHYRGKSS